MNTATKSLSSSPLAVSGDQTARIGLQPGREPGGSLAKEREVGIIALEGVKWAKPAAGPERFKAITKVSQVLQPGDVVYVEPNGKESTQFRLHQIPEVSGGLVAMDPQTGRVLALVGGFSFSRLCIGGVTGLNFYSMFVAVIGAILVLLVYHMIAGRKALH